MQAYKRQLFPACWLIWMLYWFVIGLNSHIPIARDLLGIHEHYGELQITAFAVASISGFPSSGLVGLLVAATPIWFWVWDSSGLCFYIFQWVGMVGAGYIQWFVFLPKIISAIRKG